MTHTHLLPDLPISSVLPDLANALQQKPQVIVQAPPGAGKTTLVPLYLLHEDWLAGQKILVLEPRRIAARACAQHMAALLGETIGQCVGYRIRQETKVSSVTRIEVITGGVFIRMLQQDPSLEGVGLVIFDEFHERHLDSDLGLALSLQSQQVFRDDPVKPLRLLVMSATLDTAGLQQLLPQAPLITSEGRRYPVAIVHGKTPSLRDSIVEPVVQTILQALTEPGNMLVFLPGQGEINGVHRALIGKVPADTLVMPLFSGLSLTEQQRVIGPLPAHQRKIVLATNIAETSLTIEGVSLVVDSGLCREPVFDPSTGLTRLQTQRISRASATQRAGRAGRLSPGRCWRLWSAEQILNEQSTPEMQQADLAPLALQLVSWGINDPTELQWLTPPPKASYRQALELLLGLGALSEMATGQFKLTPGGQQMVLFPAHPRLANMLLQSRLFNCSTQAAWLAAILTETARGPEQTDLGLLVEWLSQSTLCKDKQKPLPSPDLRHFSHWVAAVTQQAKSFLQQLDSCPKPATMKEIVAIDIPGFLLACAYPDRLAKRRADLINPGQPLQSYLLANGRAAILSSYDGLAKCEWLAVATTGGSSGRSDDKIYCGCAFNPELFSGPLAYLTRSFQQVHWDKKLGRFIGQDQIKVGALVLRERKLTELPVHIKRQALVNLVRQDGLQLLPWSEPSRQLQARVNLLREQDNLRAWPDFSDEGLLATLETWLAPHLDTINKIDDFAKLDLLALLQQQLAWPLPKHLDELAPSHWVVPTGSNIPIDYTSSPPTLAVKLQEMFGAQVTPAVVQGRVLLTLHLLSPARRPLQITQDLAGFWRSSYQDVKKEMKGRYPRHPWPDDPLAAPPQRGVKKRPN